MRDSKESLTFLPAPLPDKGGPSAACLTDANMSSITKASSALLRAAVHIHTHSNIQAQHKQSGSLFSNSGFQPAEVILDSNQLFLFQLFIYLFLQCSLNIKNRAALYLIVDIS